MGAGRGRESCPGSPNERMDRSLRLHRGYFPRYRAVRAAEKEAREVNPGLTFPRYRAIRKTVIALYPIDVKVDSIVHELMGRVPVVAPPGVEGRACLPSIIDHSAVFAHFAADIDIHISPLVE